MARDKDFLDPDEVEPLSPTQIDPPLKPIGGNQDWRKELDSGRDEAPTSAHEDEGWRALKTY
jgi:hypothetical protein